LSAGSREGFGHPEEPVGGTGGPAGPLARDAFHNYGQRLYLIGKRQSQGSQRQKAVFMPAKWFFDRVTASG
jgi:hypothetical protein